MTPGEFSKHLPPFTSNRLRMKPPFAFNGVSVRVFPLRADLDALQELCNGYLNLVPLEVGNFRAFVPYVYLMVLDYGQLSDPVTQTGWFAQVEVLFLVPVEWYKLVHGKWVFHDWAVITPYIFVDDNFSVPMGRTVFGFTKILSKVTATPSSWTHNALSSVTLARIETQVFPEAYADKGLEKRVFLEVQRDAPMSNFRVPTDPGSPIMPWKMASNIAEAMNGFARDAIWLAQAMRIHPLNPGTDPSAIPEMLARLAPGFAPSGSGFIQNSLNLKQFRRADDVSGVCYQALTNGPMRMTGFLGGGLLGEERTFFGDLSGGHTINLYQQSSLPIERVLGLEVSRQWRAKDADVSELKPVLPFWMSMNLIYEQGINLAWRKHDGIWRDGAGAPLNPCIPASKLEPPLFNSTVPTALDAITGPFEYSGTTIRVLPLLANLDKVQSFVDKLVNEPLQAPIVREHTGEKEQLRLSVWARPPAPIGGEFAYVYLTATSFANVLSKTNNVGDWAKYELSFLIPVKWERLKPGGNKDENEDWDVIAVGLLPAGTFVDDCIAAISRSEIQGINAFTANFVRPENVWLKEGESDIDSKQTFLRVDAEVWPALGAGQKARIETIIEIDNHDPTFGLGNADSHDTARSWAETLRLELGEMNRTQAANPDECSIARALALELLGNQTPFSLYTLKQFRDVCDPDKACYQELLIVPRVLKEVFDIGEIEETLVVRLHDFPSLKIAEDLGILGPTVEHSGAGIVHSAQAIRPFYIRATMTEPLAQRLLSRSGTLEWSLSKEAFDSLLSGSEDQPPITADCRAQTDMNQLRGCSMAALMFQANERRTHDPSARQTKGNLISKTAAREALKNVDPQMIVGSILSREWGNSGDACRWRKGYSDLLKIVDALPSGKNNAAAEADLYLFVNNLLAQRPGSVATRLSPEDLNRLTETVKNLHADQITLVGRLSDGDKATLLENGKPQDELGLMILSQKMFTECRAELEEAYDGIAPFLLPGGRGHFGADDKGSQPKSPANLGEAALRLITAMDSVAELAVIGFAQVSSGGQILAENTRLKQLLEILKQNATQPGLLSGLTGSQVGYFINALELARKRCDAQRPALLEKLTRAYQKPDFCIRRDSLGASRDELLSTAASWDDDWYYGQAGSV
ncbi:MAG TPA: hypothetical protein VGK48_07140 [Terriglobia bacterium]|jgi:hypothetical protein